MTDHWRTCHDLGDGCPSYGPGHQMHFIHANQLGKRPWGWRDGVVSSIDGGKVEVDYVTVEGRVVLGYHLDLNGLIAPGALVRVHEELHAIGGRFGWLNVALLEGIGPVPTPADTSVWVAEQQVAVTDLASGRAVAVDHLGSPGPDTPAR